MLALADSTRQQEIQQRQTTHILWRKAAAQLRAQLRVIEGEVTGQVAAETSSLLVQVDGGADDGEVGVRGELDRRKGRWKVVERRRGAREGRAMQGGGSGRDGVERDIGFFRTMLDGSGDELVVVENAEDLFSFYVCLRVRGRENSDFMIVVIHQTKLGMKGGRKRVHFEYRQSQVREVLFLLIHGVVKF